jgi:hypothetical protein
MRVRATLLSLVVCAVLIPHATEAAPIVFTDRAAFEAATQPNVAVPFNSFEPVFENVFCQFPTRGMDCFATVDGILDLTVFTFVGTEDPVGSLRFAPFTDVVQMGLVAGQLMTAIGFDITFQQPSPLQFLALGGSNGGISGSIGDAVRLPAIGTSFVGLLFDTPVPFIAMSSNTNGISNPIPGAIHIDNLAIATAVPEPSTAALLLVAGALVSLRRVHRRR